MILFVWPKAEQRLYLKLENQTRMVWLTTLSGKLFFFHSCPPQKPLYETLDLSHILITYLKGLQKSWYPKLDKHFCDISQR